MGDEAPHRLRTRLLGQLRYLTDEAVAMEPVIGRLHEPALVTRDRGPSVKDCYGALIEWDQTQMIPKLERLSNRPPSSLESSKTDWNAWPLRQLLKEVIRTRRTTVALISALHAGQWTCNVSQESGACDLYGLAHQTVQHDLEMLRTIAERLHEDR